MSRIVFAVLSLLSCTPASKHTNAVGIELEVGYRIFGGIFHRTVWPLCRVPHVAGDAIVAYGNDLIVEFRCDAGLCHVIRLLNRSENPEGPWLTARVLSEYSGTDRAVLLFEPFPTTVDRELFRQLKQSDDSTKVVRAIFVQDRNRHLRFLRLEYLRQETGAPFVWK